MSNKSKYTEISVLRSLAKKHDCKVVTNLSEIQILTGNKQPKKNDLGNGSWGKIDYLINFMGYHKVRMHKFEHTAPWTH